MRRTLFKRVLDFDISVVLIFLFLLFAGIFSLTVIKVTFLPRHSETVLTILTDYYGMDASLIEEIITKPIEGLLKEVEGIHNFYSYTGKGRSRILVYLNKNEDANRIAVIIKDKIYHISDTLPSEVQEPAILRYNTDDSPVMIVSLHGRMETTAEIYSYVESHIKPELLSVDGIAHIELAGSGRDEYLIEQDYTNIVRLKADGPTLFKGIVENNTSIPLGSVKDGNNLSVVTFPNRYADLFSLPLYSYDVAGNLVSGADLFSVKRRRRENERVSFVNNEPALTMYVFKRDFSSILEIEKSVNRVLKKSEDIFTYRYIYNQAKKFRNLLVQLEIGLAAAVLCVGAVVFLFYKKFLFTFLVIITIPLCMAGTVTLLKLFSKSLNIMTLSGIIVGIGICVDNTIIMIETVRREMGRRYSDDCLSSSMEKVHRPIIASTLTTIIVFFPLLYMDERISYLYSDFALSVSLMLVFSCLISVFFIPSFINCFYGEKKSRTGGDFKGKWKVNARRERVSCLWKKISLLPWFIIKQVVKHPAISLSLFFIISCAFMVAFVTLDYEEISPLKVNEFEAYFEYASGYHLNYKRDVMLSVGKKILDLQIPCTLVSKLDDNRATYFFRFPAGYNHYKRDVTRIKNAILGMSRRDGFFYFQRGKETGIKSVSVLFFGDNLERLDVYVDRVSEHLIGLHGVRRVLKGYKGGESEIEFTMNPEKTYYFGLNVSDVIRFLRFIFYQPVIMKYYNGKYILDVRGKIGTDPLQKEKISALRVPNDKGEYIPLSDFSDMTVSRGAGAISRKNGKRYISVDIRYEGIKETLLVQHIQNYLKETRLEDDFYYEFDEELRERRKSRILFFFALCLALYLVYSVLGIIFKSFATPLIIILTVPSVFIGSFIFLGAGGYGRSIPAHIALIMLMGLSVNSIILLVESFFRLHKKGIQMAILLCYRRKMRLIALTMVTTVISLLPVFLMSTSTYFFRILTGVMAAGMLSVLIFSLAVLPALLKLFWNKKSLH